MSTITFKEFLKLQENGIMQPQGSNPTGQANTAIINTAKTMNNANKDMDAPTLLNTAAKQAVLQNKVQPGAAIAALKPAAPGSAPQSQTAPKMMKKKMDRK